MSQRKETLQKVADAILSLPAAPVVRVGIDGVDGAGKTMFGDELALLLAEIGRPIIRASVDGFHNPRALRYRLGRASPLGYFRDSYDYDQLKAVLLDPLSPGGNGRYRTAIFDYRTDTPVVEPVAQAKQDSILIFDGIFLYRLELRHYWDFSIFLEVNFNVSIARCAQRDGAPDDPQAPENRRYVEGQQIYLRECDPMYHASMVVNNDIIAAPVIVR